MREESARRIAEEAARAHVFAQQTAEGTARAAAAEAQAHVMHLLQQAQQQAQQQAAATKFEAEAQARRQHAQQQEVQRQYRQNQLEEAASRAIPSGGSAESVEGQPPTLPTFSPAMNTTRAMRGFRCTGEARRQATIEGEVAEMEETERVFRDTAERQKQE